MCFPWKKKWRSRICKSILVTIAVTGLSCKSMKEYSGKVSSPDKRYFAEINGYGPYSIFGEGFDAYLVIGINEPGKYEKFVYKICNADSMANVDYMYGQIKWLDNENLILTRRPQLVFKIPYPKIDPTLYLNALSRFFKDTSMLPEQDIKIEDFLCQNKHKTANWQGPYLMYWPMTTDYFQNEIRFTEVEDGAFRLYSAGKDRQKGTDDDWQFTFRMEDLQEYLKDEGKN